MKTYLTLTATILAGAALATPYYWHGGDWGDYGTVANWTLGATSSPYGDTSTKADVPPTSSDWLYAVSGQTKLDLGGKDWSLAAWGTSPTAGNPSGAAYLSITNGSLAIDAAAQKNEHFRVYSDAVLTYKYFYGGWGGSKEFDVYAGGTLILRPTAGYLRCQRGSINVVAGGEAVIDVPQFGIHRGTSYDMTFENNGVMSFPSGCTMSYPTMGGSDKETWTVKWMLRQNAGTMLFGADVGKKLDTTFPFHFEANGGTIVFSNTVAFVNFAVAHVTAGNTVTFECVKDAVADVSGLSFEDGSSVVKTGVGELRFGATPPALTVRAGTVRFIGEATDATAYSADAGTLFVFASKTVPTLSAAKFTGYANADFAIDETVFATGDTIVSSEDADLLAHVAAKINANLSAAVEYEAQVQGEVVRLALKATEHVFDATVSDDLSNAAAWGGTVPPSTATVTLSGAGTVRLTPTSPTFAAVNLANGVRLNLTGGSEAEPLVVPPLNLIDGVSCHVTDGSYVAITNEFASSGTSSTLPVFEIETNATALVGWRETSSTQPVCASFKNIDFRLYGTLALPEQPSKNTYMNITFGTAEDGETSYLAFRSEGGCIKRTYTASTSGADGTSLVNFVRPESGGRVEVVDDIVLRDFHTSPQDSRVVRHAFSFGVDNPTDVPFNVRCAGATVMIPNGSSTLAGAARVTFSDTASLIRGRSVHNVTVGSSVTVTDLATLAFESGTKFFLYHAEPNGSGFIMRPSDSDREVVTLKGATFQSADGGGNTNGIVRIEDGAFEIGHRAPMSQGSSGDPSTNRIAVFAGAKDVWVPEGKTFTVRAVNDASFSSYSVANYQWDRLVFLDAPVIGGGDVIVSNALTETYATWGTTLAVTSGENELTGEIRAETNVLANVVFHDGANWAGTVVANGRVSLTNDAWEVTDAPATVSFNRLRFEGTFPIRVWKTGGALTNDVVNLTAWEGAGGFSFVATDGYQPQHGDTVTLGTYPTNEPLPPVADRHWQISAEEFESGRLLKATYVRRGTVLLLK